MIVLMNAVSNATTVAKTNELFVFQINKKHGGVGKMEFEKIKSKKNCVIGLT